MAKLLTQKQYAQRIGKSPQYVNKLVHQGKIELAKDRLIDPKQADAALKAWARPGAKTPHGQSGAKKAAKRKAAAKKAGKASARARRRSVPVEVRTEPTHRRGSATNSLTAWRAKEVEVKTKLAELELQRAMRDALPRAEVLAGLQLVLKNFQMSLRRMARALPPRLHGHVFAKQEELLLEDFDTLLLELSDDPLGLLASAPAMVPPPAPAMAEGSIAV